MKCESDKLDWRKFEDSENLNQVMFKVEYSLIQVKLLKVNGNQRWWNMKLKRSEV